MNTRTSILALILGSCCAMMGAGLPLQAQGDKNAKAPLSFKSLGNDQAIVFSVGAEHTSFSAAQVCFLVEVSGPPQPQVKIRMVINSSMRIAEAEKAWGHRVGEEIIRPVQPGELQTLEDFLNAHRAKGSLAHSSLEGYGDFTLVTYHLTKEGLKRPDVEKHEYYNPLPAAERQNIIRNFIGFNP